MSDNVLYISLAAYYVLLLLLLLFAPFGKSGKGRAYDLLFAAFIPFFGLAILLLNLLGRPRKSSAAEAFAQFEETEDKIFVADVKKESDLISIKDVLSYNDAKTKRRVVLDIFRSDSEKYIPELKIALNDSDTEVSHYAAAALNAIKRKYENRIILLGEQMKQEGSETSAVYAYADTLRQYINYDIMDINGREKYKKIYCQYVSKCLHEKQAAPVILYDNLVEYLMDLGDAESAVACAEEYLVFRTCENSYLAMLKCCYRLRKKELFFRTLKELKDSGIPLSSEHFRYMKYFLRLCAG